MSESNLRELRDKYNATAMSEKRTDEWGEMKANALWNTAFSKGQIPLEGKSFLDFGCSWGYFGKLLTEKAGVASYTGVDINAHWKLTETSWDWRSDLRINLFQGDLCEIPEIQGSKFDVIYTFGTLYSIGPEQLIKYIKWMYEHLADDGIVVIANHTFSSWSGGGLLRDVSIPGAHLLFPRFLIDNFLMDHGCYLEKCPNNNRLTVGSYLSLYKRTGFFIQSARRSKNKIPEDVYQTFEQKLSQYPKSDLKVSVITTLLSKKNEESKNDSFDLSHLEKLNSEHRSVKQLIPLLSKVPSRSPSLKSMVSTFDGKNLKGAIAVEDEFEKILERSGKDLEKNHVLVFGCGLGAFSKQLAEKFKSAKVLGVDESPVWEFNTSDLTNCDNLELMEGGVDSLLERQAEPFNTIFALDVFERFSPTALEDTLEKLYGLLQPGGSLICRIRPWTSSDLFGLSGYINVPAPHLLFSEDVLNDFLKQNYEIELPTRNWLTEGAYMSIVHRVGFEVIKSRKELNPLPQDYKERFKDVLGYMSEDETEVEYIELHLTRPWEIQELQSNQG